MYELTKEPIKVQAAIDYVLDRNCGAITTFIGTVRELTHGKKTIRLEYHAYETMAIKMLQKIGEEVEERWPGTTIAIIHRLGILDISDMLSLLPLVHLIVKRRMKATNTQSNE